jgi:hypothetical protein
MTTFENAGQIQRDANRQPIVSNEYYHLVKRITFDGGIENGIGDASGTSNPYNVFSVTGEVIASFFGFVKEDLVGLGNVTLGVTGDLDRMIPQITAGSSAAWLGSIADDGAALEGDYDTVFLPRPRPLSSLNSPDIQVSVNDDVTAGAIDFYCLWRPLSVDGLVEAA